jgi:ribonuclease BN (tRNA processing enzyme)
LRLKVVGSSPAASRPGGASSCYLLETDEAVVALDFGSGAFGKLQLATDYADLSGILISHMHADHFFDLVPLRHGLKYASERGTRVPLWLPPGGRRALEALRNAVAIDAPADFFDGVFEISEYDPSQTLQFGDLCLTFRRTRHYVEGYAVRAQDGAASVTYSADSAPSDAVIEHARASSIFLCEAALGLGSEDGQRGHSSAAEAGEMAQRAGARQLVLTHYPARWSVEELVAAARSRFDGVVSVAEDGLQFSVLGSSLGSEN